MARLLTKFNTCWSVKVQLEVDEQAEEKTNGHDQGDQRQIFTKQPGPGLIW